MHAFAAGAASDLQPGSSPELLLGAGSEPAFLNENQACCLQRGRGGRRPLPGPPPAATS